MMRWWSQKYNLPPNHELCVSQSTTALVTEMYEDLYAKKAELEAELKTAAAPREHTAIARQLEQVEKALGEKSYVSAHGDDLIDKWERELAEGKTPDLTEGLVNA